jgi:hypothetical protein
MTRIAPDRSKQPVRHRLAHEGHGAAGRHRRTAFIRSLGDGVMCIRSRRVVSSRRGRGGRRPPSTHAQLDPASLHGVQGQVGEPVRRHHASPQSPEDRSLPHQQAHARGLLRQFAVAGGEDLPQLGEVIDVGTGTSHGLPVGFLFGCYNGYAGLPPYSKRAVRRGLVGEAGFEPATPWPPDAPRWSPPPVTLSSGV